MQTGWKQINGKWYYFEPNPNKSNYGMAAVGSTMIDGQTYVFGTDCALKE